MRLITSPRLKHNVDKCVRCVNIVNVKGYLQKHRFHPIRKGKNINSGQLLTTNLNLSNPKHLHLKFSNQDYKHTAKKNIHQLLVKMTFTMADLGKPRGFFSDAVFSIKKCQI